MRVAVAEVCWWEWRPLLRYHIKPGRNNSSPTEEILTSFQPLSIMFSGSFTPWSSLWLLSALAVNPSAWCVFLMPLCSLGGHHPVRNGAWCFSALYSARQCPSPAEQACYPSLPSSRAMSNSRDTDPKKVLWYRWKICYGGAFWIPGILHCGIQLQSGCAEICLSITTQGELNKWMKIFFSPRSCGFWRFAISSKKTHWGLQYSITAKCHFSIHSPEIPTEKWFLYPGSWRWRIREIPEGSLVSTGKEKCCQEDVFRLKFSRTFFRSNWILNKSKE